MNDYKKLECPVVFLCKYLKMDMPIGSSVILEYGPVRGSADFRLAPTRLHDAFQLFCQRLKSEFLSNIIL